MKLSKIVAQLAVVVLILFSTVATHADDKDENIKEEVPQRMIELLTPMLRGYGMTFKDFPNQIKLLTAKYYNYFQTALSPLDTLELLQKDFELIKSNKQIENKKFKKDVKRFMNNLHNEKIIEEIAINICDKINVESQVISPQDVVKFLLFRKAHPDILEVASTLVRKIHEIYKEGGFPKQENKGENKNDNVNPEVVEKVVIPKDRVDL